MSRARNRRGKHGPKLVTVSPKEMSAILEKTKASLTPEEHQKLRATVETGMLLAEELKNKATSIKRLRNMLFGASTEKTSEVLGDAPEEPGKGGEEDPGQEKKAAEAGDKKRPGHGRLPAAAYNGAQKKPTGHPTLDNGAYCPTCQKGHVYVMKDPEVLVRITGMAPLSGIVYENERLRCNLCGEVFTAPAPEGIGEEKYDETASAMIGMLKYGAGLPFNRIETLQAAMGIPLPAGTQWGLVLDAAGLLFPAHQELIRQAAQGKVLYNDDTTMKVLELTARQRAAAADDEQTDGRTGVFTSGIVSTAEAHPIALFFTGAQHAGENLASVLARRAAELPKPIQMCDALPSNTAGNAAGTFDTILASCMAHARRRYVEVADDFPEECRHVLETLREVYKTDSVCRARGLSDEDRLHLHQQESGPRMDDLEKWMKQQLEEHKVEPNSGLGEAIGYMRKHWTKLTLFLRMAGAPLDNNICERVLKKAILHRKNALFYKTLNGARVGDTFMSLIHTAELNGVPPYEYLLALLRHHEAVRTNPGAWMPWSYRESLASSAPPPPAQP